MKQTVLVTGAGGQLGRELILSAGAEVNCIAIDRQALDIADLSAVINLLREYKPQAVINAAAYTAVDRAETEPEAAWQANALGPGHLAQVCASEGVRLIHISTDFVFDGESSQPYSPDSPPAPVSEYGRGKLAGEQAVLEALPGALIVRTAWVYSRFGGNFVKTMLGLMSQREELGVVSDQVGTPTWARGLAIALWAAAVRPQLSGIYHWSDSGSCSWYEFALAIYEEGRACGLLDREVAINAIPGSSYPTPARRPAYSVLDESSSLRDFELRGVPWRRQLQAMLLDMRSHLDE